VIFSLDVRRAREGDCLLLHFGTSAEPGLAIVDGGPAQVYARHLKPRLQAITAARGLPKDQPLPIDLVMISHIDDDHITGILDLTRELVMAKDARSAPLVKIRNVWHNTFDDILGNGAQELATAVSAQFAAAALGGDTGTNGLNVVSAKVLASVAQGLRLRDDARKLALRVNREFGGGLVMAAADSAPVDMGHGLMLTVMGPMKGQLVRLQKQHDHFLREHQDQRTPSALAEFTDNSIPNLSSIVVLAEVEGKRMLLTGDARGDRIIEGLELVGRLTPGGTLEVDILKMPHHGSARNMEASFLQRVRARHYVFSGNGEHGNPERETLEMLRDARPDRQYEIHLTYPVKEIDEARRKDWGTEQNKERGRRTTNPWARVRPDWSPPDNSLHAFFEAHPDMAARVRVVDADAPHVIDLLEPLA
jgi:beta-lactamase superfamily II metal-dependent hydrolase